MLLAMAPWSVRQAPSFSPGQNCASTQRGSFVLRLPHNSHRCMPKFSNVNLQRPQTCFGCWAPWFLYVAGFLECRPLPVPQRGPRKALVEKEPHPPVWMGGRAALRNQLIVEKLGMHGFVRLKASSAAIVSIPWLLSYLDSDRVAVISPFVFSGSCHEYLQAPIGSPNAVEIATPFLVSLSLRHQPNFSKPWSFSKIAVSSWPGVPGSKLHASVKTSPRLHRCSFRHLTFFMRVWGGATGAMGPALV